MTPRGTRQRGIIPYVPDAVPEAAKDPLLTDYLRRELEKIQDALRELDELRSRIEALEP